MNLWFRLIGYIATIWRRGPLAVPDGASELTFRVWPADLDISLHMNNGRYAAIMDFGRLDVMVRTGLWKAVRRHGWTPIASSLAIRFRRELRLWQRFRLVTRITAWQSEQVIFEHRFVFMRGRRAGQTAAIALVQAGLYDRDARAFVPIERLFQEIGESLPDRALGPEHEALLAADATLREQARNSAPAGQKRAHG